MKRLIAVLVMVAVLFTLSGCSLVLPNISGNGSSEAKGNGESVIEEETVDNLVAQYTIERVDKSYKNSKGFTLIEHYYDLVQLKGESKAVGIINNSLKAEMDSFFFSDVELREYANDPVLNVADPFIYTMESSVCHNAGGYISISMSSDWYMGGVFNTDYYGATYNLTTGLPATLVELTGRDRESLERELKDKVWKYFDDLGYEYLYDETTSELLDYKLEEFDFLIRKGEIVLLFPSYTFVPDAVVINTGVHVIGY